MNPATRRTFQVFVLAIVCCQHAAAWTPQQPFHTSSAIPQDQTTSKGPTRRSFLAHYPKSIATATILLAGDSRPSWGEEVATEAPLASIGGDAKKLFNDGRVFESQGNIAAAQRLYYKVTKIEPRDLNHCLISQQYIYGWSNLGNTQVALGELAPAEESYTKAINLCQENLATTEKGFGVPRCNDLSILLLNRGSLRLNNGMPKEALEDLESSSVLRGRPDAVILQNLARARELNGYYSQSDRDYTLAISMTANEVNPFWLRSALVKLQLGDVKGGFDLLKRVDNRFPEAPEVRAAYATFLAAKGDQTAAQQKFLEIPDIQRKKFSQEDYLKKVISWPPVAIDSITKISAAVGDEKRFG